MSSDTQVLALPRRQIAEYFYHAAFVTHQPTVNRVLGIVATSANYVDRAFAEQTPDLTQIVASSIVYNERSILCVRRSADEARVNLRSRHTILFGGHVSESDSQSASPLHHCVARELNEELGLETAESPRLIGFVTDPFTTSGRLHIGFVFSVQFSSNRMLLRGDDRSEFAFRRTNQKSITFLQWEQIARHAQSFDSWSGTILYTAELPTLLGLTEPFPLPDLQLRLPEF